MVTTINNDNISDSTPYWLYGVDFNHLQTASFTVAETVRDLIDGSSTEFGSFVIPSPVSMSVRANIDSIMPGPLAASLLFFQSSGARARSVSYNYSLNPSTTEPIQGEPFWFAEVMGTNGITTNGVSLQVNATNSLQATVTVENGLVGDVVLYAGYSSTNGTLIFALPRLVTSNPIGTTLIGIQLILSPATMPVGATVIPEVWGIYDNGAVSRIFIPTENVPVFSSSNPGCVLVDSNGLVHASAVGSSTISVTYQGLTQTR